LNISRYPPTQNRSLRAWSAADEYVLSWIKENESGIESIAIANDSFGFLACHLHKFKPYLFIERYSQQKSLEINLKNNQLEPETERWLSPLTPTPNKTDLGIIAVPKSMELFRLYLRQIHSGLKPDGTVICSFMTRHFTPQMLSIADEFFRDARQSLAWKKSRLLILKKKRENHDSENLNIITYALNDGEPQEIKQYPGVFSSGNIDYATQFLLKNLELRESDELILDLGSGNGIIAKSIRSMRPNTEIHLLDDSILAIESSRLNLRSGMAHFHWNDSLENVKDLKFDLIVSNPPFHFEHEVNTEITVDLFREAAGNLKPGGRFVCVANKHLGYRTHLKKFFTNFAITAESDKYILYQCTNH
jgi:23S rRNA (guanine1835-N2)-methyltransferase